MKSIVGKILVDRYRIVQQLSQNDWSIVYLAEDLTLGSKGQCQIEQLHPQYDHEVLGAQSWQKVLQTFVVQGELLMKISHHPQIPQLLAFFECDREFYLVREYIQGISLEQRLNDSLLAETEALDWLKEILGILESIHQLGMAHLNIQPSSLIQVKDGRKFLTNFAAIKSTILFNNRELIKVLNPDFSPENQSGSDFNADLHALGKTIIYALTGILSESIQAKSAEVISNNLTNLNPAPKANIRPELALILNKMATSIPEHGYQSATVILNELDFPAKVVTFPPPFKDGFRLPQRAPAKVKPLNKFLASLKPSPETKKIHWFFLSLPFIVALIILFIGFNKNSEGNLVRYTNDDYRFSLKYPETWSEEQIDNPITGEIVVFSSPKETDTDAFAEKVYVAVEDLSAEPVSLQQYSQAFLDRIKESESGHIELYEVFKTKIDNAPARTVIYSRQQGSLQLRQMESFTIKNNQVYIAIYTAERDKFAKYYPTAKKIINSWDIK